MSFPFLLCRFGKSEARYRFSSVNRKGDRMRILYTSGFSLSSVLLTLRLKDIGSLLEKEIAFNNKE